MTPSFIKTILLTLALSLPFSSAFADDEQPRKPKQTKAASKPKPAKKDSKAEAPAAPLIDINSASKDELKKLPGIGDADADKIIAGRPYLTKAHLQTHNIVSPGVYQGLRKLVVARQKLSASAPGAKK